MNITIFMIVIFILFEIVIRVFHLTPDIPQREIVDGVQKYKPHQSGYFNANSTEKWKINEFGWPGLSNIDSATIVAILGDSFIENFHNPYKCHQASYLKSVFPEISFFEAARSGMSLIEELEVRQQLEKQIKPLVSLIYISESDIIESIQEIRLINDVTQFSLSSGNVIQGELKAPFLKNVLYNIKALHYLYLNRPKNDSFVPSNKATDRTNLELHNKKITAFIDAITENYNLSAVVFIFHPQTDKDLISLFEDRNLEVLSLRSSDYKAWQFSNDSHWNCEGHKSAAIQVAVKLESMDIMKTLKKPTNISADWF